MATFKELTEILHNLVVALAAIVGGLWVVDRIKRERTDEAALEMSLSTSSSVVGTQHLVVLTVHLVNKGKTKIQAKSERDGRGFVFSEDGEQAEKLRFPCSVQLKQLDPTAINGSQRLNWFAGGPWKDVLGSEGPEINVLLEYENPERDNKVEFWMEPGETYHLGVPWILEKGTYLAKLTFVAAPQETGWLDKVLDEIGFRRPPSGIRDENFWSQIFGFSVPAVSNDKKES